MKKNESIFPVSRMCQVLGVARSGYYSWKTKPESNRYLENKKLLEQIVKIHSGSKKRYGSPKIVSILHQKGYKCGHNRVARIMKDNNIRSKAAKKYRFTNSVIKKDQAKENILNRKFQWSKKNKAWVTDITYIPTQKGWVYLCAFMDLYSRSIVGWSLSYSMKKELVINALQKACANRAPSKGLIIHSDQGSQYGSHDYQDFLNRHDFVQSMSRRGNCWDNACIESFFRLLKVEELNEYNFKNIEEVKYIVFCYIDYFYNRKRVHSMLGYQSPLDFENKNCA